MKKLILTIAVAVAGFANASAQDLSNCKKVCETQKLVEVGPFIGIRFSVIPNSNKSIIHEVIPNTAAQGIGLKVNDIIIVIDGKSPRTNTEFLALVAAHKPGDIVDLTYSRAGVVYNKHIRIGASGARMVTVKECCEEQVPTIVEDPIQQINFDLSPNPAETFVTIRANQRIDADVQVKIYDATGKLVNQFTKANKGAFEMPLDVTAYTNGEYIAKITTKDNTFTARFIVIH
jgi:membrane-associated protease RseP (regulator of RpoE activity)